MIDRTCVLSAPLFALLALVLPLSLSGADIQSNYGYQSTVSSDLDGPLDLVAELNYDDTQLNAPIMVVMHAYSGTTGASQVRDQAQRLRDRGFFVIAPSMRGRGGSDGVRDSGGVEIHDIYDAVEAVKSDLGFSTFIDPSNVSITGYSGGGGNTMSALTKFPDYFRAGAAFFGMSDYGYDLTNGWYNDGADSRTSQLDTDIGNPNTGGITVLDRYLARASNLASKNNPYSEIHLFVNSSETICPPWNDTSYRDNAVAAAGFAGEFDNITVHIGSSGTYEDFNNNSVDDANELQSWPHGFPSANQQDAGELWFRDWLLSGSIPQPLLNNSDEIRVAGYLKTARFGLWLGDGQDGAADLTYSLSSSLKTFALQIASSDSALTGELTVDTADMSGRQVSVELNDSIVDSFSGGGQYTYSALGHDDILELIDSGPASTNLIAYYDFEGDTEDSSGNGNHGTNNGVTFSTDVTSSLSHSSKSGSFTGDSTSGDYVDLGSLGIYSMAQSGGVTISMWVKGASQTGWTFAEGDDSDGDSAFVFGGHTGIGGSDDFVTFFRESDDDPSTVRDSATVVFDSSWNHVVWTGNSGSASVYIDGVLDSTNFDYTPIADTFDNTSIGAWLKAGVASFGFTGLIDDVAIYARVLDSSEVSALAAGANPVGGNGFTEWIAGYPGVGPETGLDEDPDGDGVDSGVENYFGTDPSAFSGGLTAGSADANTFTFTHPINDTPADDLTAAYKWSKDLVTFNEDGATDGDSTTVEFELVDLTAGIATVEATVTGTSTEKLFILVEVTQN